MIYCHFCEEPIHFWESFYMLYGKFFHVQNLTNDTLRCNRPKNKHLEKVEKEIERRKQCLAPVATK